MKKAKTIATLVAVLLFSTVVVGIAGEKALAKRDKPTAEERAAHALTQTYWFDGERKRKAYLNPHLVAEFGAFRSSAVKNVYPQAREVLRKGGVRLWQVDSDAPAAIARLKSAQPHARYSPVLHDGPSAGHRMRALPGGVIVTLNPQWDEATVYSWAAAKQLEIIRKLEIGPNIYVVKTGPGLEALETANALYQSGEVEAASPNWWREATTR